MKFKKALFTLVAGCLSLAACTKTNNPSKSKIVGDIIDYLESRNVTIETIPYIEYIDDLKVLDTDTFVGDEEYVPYFYFLLEGDVVDLTLDAFKKANWTVPAIESEYGYECVDPTQKVEIDVFYSDKADEGSGIGTNYYVYSYADLHSSYNGDPTDETAKSIALQIATAIYGADKAEENIGLMLGIYYTSYIFNGTDLGLALTDGLRYIPQGFEVVEEPTIDSLNGEEYGTALLMNADGYAIKVDSWAGEEAGTIEVTYFVGLAGGDDEFATVADAMDNFLLSRGILFEAPAFFENVDTTDLVYSETFEGDDYYVPYYYFVLEGNVVEEVLVALREAGWTVPTTPDEDYGYECVDPNQLVEIDVLYVTQDDAEEGIYAGTNCTVYSYSDIYGEGAGGDDWGDLEDPAAEAVALAIATSIYGADAAEENVSWFFLYFVMNTISGTDLRAAIQSEAQHIPAGFTQEGEIEVSTETDEETGETYDVAAAIFVNAEGVVVDLEATFSEEQGKIDIMYLVYSDDGGDDTGDDELPGDQEGDSNVVENPDGSKTVTVDFSGFTDKATYSGQTVGDLNISTFKDKGTNDTTYYKNGESLRIYWGTGLKFTVPQGKELVKVEFTCTTGNDKTVDVNESNLTVTGGTYTVNDKNVIITANQGVNELSMLINLERGNVAITNISVTYK